MKNIEKILQTNFCPRWDLNSRPLDFREQRLNQ